MNGDLDQLTPGQSREIDRIGRMIASGEDETVVEQAWAELVKTVVVGATRVDVDALVDTVAKASYLAMADDLRRAADRVSRIDVDDCLVRDHLAQLRTDALRSELDTARGTIERRLAGARTTRDRSTIELQSALQRQQQMQQTLSNMMKAMHDMAMAIIRNMR